MVQWTKALNGKGEASQGRSLLAKRGEVSDNDQPTQLHVKKSVLGTCVFVDVVYVFIHLRVRHRFPPWRLFAPGFVL